MTLEEIILELNQEDIHITLIQAKFEGDIVSWFSSLYQSGKCIGIGKGLGPQEALTQAVSDTLQPRPKYHTYRVAEHKPTNTNKKLGLDDLL